MAQQRKPELLVHHERAGADDVAELGIPPESQGSTDVDPPWTVTGAVEPEPSDCVGAALTESEVPAPIATEQVAVESTIGKVARDPGREAESTAVDRA